MFLSPVDTKGIHESNLLYEREKTARRSREEEVVAILQKLCLEHDVNFEVTHYITACHIAIVIHRLKQLEISHQEIASKVDIYL